MIDERILWAVGALLVVTFVGLAWSIVHAYIVRRRRLKIMLSDQR